MANGCHDDILPTQESVHDDHDERICNRETFKLGSTTKHMFDNARPHTGTLRNARRYVHAEYLKYPDFQSIEERVSSFEKWPVQIKQTPSQLAEAGFFFTGFDDCVCCFVCGGKLRRWNITDDPWTEHCRLFPLCLFAREQKGDEFIDQTQAPVLDLGNVDNVSVKEQLIIRADTEELRGALLEMGYEDSVFRKAICHLRNLGILHPTVDELTEVVSAVKDKRECRLDRQEYESSLRENRRLRSIVFCMLCGTNDVDTLFLPCRHNRTCSACAGTMKVCPACNRNTEEEIPTSMTKRM
ncbi:E3 ubiquitin-protein ligase XIAP-like [Mercenaria mercenaria]|uniref:E3 ubiquitin-protein ligase XIAP-like n=1 Tax=Mercenaria mercenaria TaxID=6596 RepID=UPI00234F3880|nr:E3 ubiquitin-protein ligase XIAP-like [Mercenaria mercenaria]XP_053392205.1 E3 ubiquitin-protein ligase XIAP-like [Mercenaria mercenaria]